MKVRAARLLALAILLVSGLGFLGMRPVHGESDFTLTNKLVVNGAVTSNLGIANGGYLQGAIAAANVLNGTVNSISFSYTFNVTGADLPVVTFFPAFVTLPTSIAKTANTDNTTMRIIVDPNVPHGSYLLNVTATSGICPGSCFAHFMVYSIKVYSIALTIDAQSTSGADITPSRSASQAASFRVGVMVANATTTGGTNPVCTVAFPCGLSLYGWSFSLKYDSTILIPQGDPNPLATPGNLGGLYVDGAQSVALYGTQTNIGEGSSNWASIAAANKAFTITQFLPNKIIVGLTLTAPLPPAFLASANGRFLLANVGFELLQKPGSPSLVSIDPSDVGFPSQRGQPECICIISTAANQGGIANETITNAPPTAQFTATPEATGSADCTPITGSPCTGYAFKFDASTSGDPDSASTLRYFWDFGDESRDSPAEATAGCPMPDSSMDCSQGAVAIHDYGASGAPVFPTFATTLRVADTDGTSPCSVGAACATGSARDNSGNPIQNSQPSHQYYTVLIPQNDFNLTVSPDQLIVTVGSQLNSSERALITLSSLNQFAGQVSLSETISPSQVGDPVVFFNVTTIDLQAGGIGRSALTVSTTLGITRAGTYVITVTAVSGSLSHSASLQVIAMQPPDQPPVAQFTFIPKAPIIGDEILFDGSQSFDPDGIITSWAWDFGDGQTVSSLPFSSIGHFYGSSGNFTVTLTVTDNGGLRGTASENVRVQPRPAHDVAITSVQFYPSVVVQTQLVSIGVPIDNLGLQPENVSLAIFYGSHLISNTSSEVYVGFNQQFVVWDTTNVPPGNYTLSAIVYLATDQNPSNNNFIDGTITIEPGPVLNLNPSNGILGTKVLVHGSGFPEQGGGEVFVSFDDNFLGFAFPANGKFDFVFNVPLAEPAKPHSVIARDIFSGIRAGAGFLVLPGPGPTVTTKVSVDTAPIYFPGDTAVVYVQTSFNGSVVGPTGVQLQVRLFLPNRTIVSLTTASVAPGLFKATYKVPSSGSLGTYGVLAQAAGERGH